MPLIAFNINLLTDRLDVARKIATAVRHSSGGLRFVKAMGVTLGDRGIVQVSMNLTHYEKTPIFRVFDLVYAMTGGGPGTATEPVALYTFNALLQHLRFGYGSALAVLVFLVTLVLALLYIRALAPRRVRGAGT